MTNEILLKQVRELKSLKMMAKELEAEINRVEDMLKAEMEARQTSKVTVDVFTLSYTTVVSHRLDTARSSSIGMPSSLSVLYPRHCTVTGAS